MDEKNYYLRNFVPIIMGWFLLCGLFGFFFILARANFATTDKEKIFVISWLLLVAIIQIYTFLFSGGLKLIGINFENRDSFLINKSIKSRNASYCSGGIPAWGNLHVRVIVIDRESWLSRVIKNSPNGFNRPVLYD